VRSWSAAPEPPRLTGTDRFPPTPGFNDQTLREVVRLSAGGQRLRLRLTNEYGLKALRIGAARIALAGPDGSIVPGSEKIVQFAGKPDAVLAAGAPLISDAVDFKVPAFARIAVSLYLPQETGPCTCHATGMQTLYVGGPGDQTGAASLPARPGPGSRAFLSGVEVDTAGPGAAIVAFGDSITDGVGSAPNLDHRWPDRLADRLGGRFGVSNEGISGNRVLHDGAAQSALARFDRDVLATPGARYVIVFEGVNDLGVPHAPPEFLKLLGESPDPVTADEMIAGYRQLIARAHGRGLKVIGATVAPYKGAIYWSAEGEQARQAINAFIRTSREFDGVIDFDAALRDPADPAQIRPGFHAGDHLHGSDAGYEAMANTIDLRLFQPPR
jgi:lysophospholipase L1-like esterase